MPPWLLSASRRAEQDVLGLAMANQGGARHTLVVLVTKYNLGWMAYADADHGYLTVDWNWLLDTTRRGSGLASAGRVLAHETGHLFHAPDEGVMPNPAGGEPIGGHVLTPDGHGYGALDFPNLNCMRTNPKSVQCLMRFAGTEGSFICQATRFHWGWVDTDGDGKLDVLP